MSSHSPSAPTEVECHLRTLLHGKRLVGELDLSPTGSIFPIATCAFREIIGSGDYQNLRNFPAVTVVFLVGEGGQCYSEGTFWGNIQLLEGASSQDTRAIGLIFESGIIHLMLEDFRWYPEAVQWNRFVTPILLHGGIPVSCAREFADVLVSRVRNGLRNPIDIVDSVLRASHSVQIARPIVRFLRHCAELALDLVDRMIEAIFDICEVGLSAARDSASEIAMDLGLHKYFVDSILSALHDTDSSQPIARTPRRARPVVRIEKYSCSGPDLVLPPVEGGGDWHITGDSPRRYAALQREEREVPLSPAPDWTAEIRACNDESTTQTTRFSGHPETRAYLFDANGHLLRDQRRIMGVTALLLVAREIEVDNGDGRGVPLREELPARNSPWHGWKLLHIETGSLDAITLTSTVPDAAPGERRAVQIRVSRPREAPTIVSSPVPRVIGPGGGPVYAEAPRITEPLGTPSSAWRVGWRSDNQRGTPPTSVLNEIPADAEQNRTLSQCLPQEPTFCGTLEVFGPLGSDLRERITVVQGLNVDLPLRIAGPGETIEATVTADCVLTTSDGTTGSSVSVLFPPGYDSAEISANGLALTLKISRLAWAVARRHNALPTFGTDLLSIGLDEIDSGDAESLLVRCGQPAEVALALHDGDSLRQTVQCTAAGEHGRWAFLLSEFRDTIATSGLARLTLILRADHTDADAVTIVASYDVTDVRAEILPDAESHESLICIQWRENRQFSRRQLRLWPEHRLWERPFCVSIPADVHGELDTVVEVAPGPYLAQVALSDEWGTPKRPFPTSSDTAPVLLGSPEQIRTRVESLQGHIGTQALELILSGDPRASEIDPQCIATEAQDELRRTIVELCRHAEQTRMLERVISLAITDDDFLLRMLVDELVWDLDASGALALALCLMTSRNRFDGTTDAGSLERLWASRPILASIVDISLDEDSTMRWEGSTGWSPRRGTSGPAQPPAPVQEPLDLWPPERLNALADALSPADSRALQLGGYAVAALEMLRKSWPDRRLLNEWMSSHSTVFSYTQRLSETQLRMANELEPDHGCSGWHRFPKRVLITAFRLTDRFASQDEHDATKRAVSEAMQIAPLMTTRALLTAAALRAATHTR